MPAQRRRVCVHPHAARPLDIFDAESATPRGPAQRNMVCGGRSHEGPSEGVPAPIQEEAEDLKRKKSLPAPPPPPPHTHTCHSSCEDEHSFSDERERDESHLSHLNKHKYISAPVGVVASFFKKKKKKFFFSCRSSLRSGAARARNRLASRLGKPAVPRAQPRLRCAPPPSRRSTNGYSVLERRARLTRRTTAFSWPSSSWLWCSH